jgi:broad specificity phosphatase PhoE
MTPAEWGRMFEGLAHVEPKPEPAAPRYAIIAGGAAIQCLTCLYISYHPQDVSQHYCGNCHRFHDDVEANTNPQQEQHQ